MSTLTGGTLNLIKPELTDDHKVTIGTDLPANFQKVDDEFTAHKNDKTQHISGNPAVRIRKDSNQSIANGEYTVVSFDAKAFDTDSMHDIAINNSRITFNTPGKYLIVAQCDFDGNATGIRGAQIYLNSTSALSSILIPNNGASYTASVFTQTLWAVSQNDYIEMKAFQNSGGALNVLLGSWIFAIKVG